MRIDPLADRPEFVPALAAALLAHYRTLLPEDTILARTARLRAHLNRDRLPIAWVAHADGQLVGMAALRVHDLPGREDLTPWLGGVYVLPPFRRRGIGAALCAIVEARAAAPPFAARVLYLMTLDRQPWYAHLGWILHQPCVWRGRPGDIMRKRLADPVSAPPSPP